MKSRIFGIVLMVIASLCFIFSLVFIIISEEASKYLFYLQMICGLAFFVIAWRSVIANKRKDELEKKKE